MSVLLLTISAKFMVQVVSEVVFIFVIHRPKYQSKQIVQLEARSGNVRPPTKRP